MNEFLSGRAAAGSLEVGLIFLRLWRDTGDRFFALFGVASWVLALDWVARAWAAPIIVTITTRGSSPSS